MNLKTVFHRVAQGCGVCLPLMLIVGLLVPGCAGKRSDMLSSLIKPKQDQSASEAAGEEASSALFAGPDSQANPSRVSAFSAEEIIEGPPKFRHRVRSWFTRDEAVMTTGDPFLADEEVAAQPRSEQTTEDRKPVASRESSRVDELLASFDTSEPNEQESIQDVKPWWDQATPADQRNGAAAGGPSAGKTADEGVLTSYETTGSTGDGSGDDSRAWWDAGAEDSSTDASEQEPTVASSPPAASPKSTFSSQFDSRLERLRAELQPEHEAVEQAEVVDGNPSTGSPEFELGEPQPTIAPDHKFAARKNGEQHDPFAAESDAAHQLPIVNGNGGPFKGETYPSLITEPRHTTAAGASTTGEHNAADGQAPLDAKARVQSMMAEARLDWEAWQLEQAWQTLVKAQNLAIRENVQFVEGEEQPRDLARRIAADLAREIRPSLTDDASPTPAASSLADPSTPGASSATDSFGFDELERLANPWKSRQSASDKFDALCEPNLAKAAQPDEAQQAEPIFESHSSGVSLLPPDDDFPSDAEGRNWNEADPRDIRLATHKFPEFSVPEDDRVREQMKGLSAEDNRALLQSVAEQKDRVLKSTGFGWPELPEAHQPAELAERSEGPIRIAQAPRYTLEDDIAIAAAPGPDGELGTPAAGGTLLGQFWHSQPIWFIGGLALLIIALRLWPRPARDDM